MQVNAAIAVGSSVTAAVIIGSIITYLVASRRRSSDINSGVPVTVRLQRATNVQKKLQTGTFEGVTINAPELLPQRQSGSRARAQVAAISTFEAIAPNTTQRSHKTSNALSKPKATLATGISARNANAVSPKTTLATGTSVNASIASRSTILNLPQRARKSTTHTWSSIHSSDNPLKDFFNQKAGAGKFTLMDMNFRGMFPAPMRRIVSHSSSTDDDLLKYFQTLMHVALYSIPLIPETIPSNDLTSSDKDAAVTKFNEEETHTVDEDPADIQFVDKTTFVSVIKGMAAIAQPLLYAGAGVLTESLLVACPGEDGMFGEVHTQRRVKSSEWMFRQVDALIPGPYKRPWLMDLSSGFPVICDYCFREHVKGLKADPVFIHFDDAMYTGIQKGQLIQRLQSLSEQTNRTIYLHLIMAFASESALEHINYKIQQNTRLRVHISVMQTFGTKSTPRRSDDPYDYLERERTFFWHKVPDHFSFPEELGAFLRMELDIREPYKVLPANHDYERVCKPLDDWPPRSIK